MLHCNARNDTSGVVVITRGAAEAEVHQLPQKRQQQQLGWAASISAMFTYESASGCQTDVEDQLVIYQQP
jgi:hypothetical protein